MASMATHMTSNALMFSVSQKYDAKYNISRNKKLQPKSSLYKKTFEPTRPRGKSSEGSTFNASLLNNAKNFPLLAEKNEKTSSTRKNTRKNLSSWVSAASTATRVSQKTATPSHSVGLSKSKNAKTTSVTVHQSPSYKYKHNTTKYDTSTEEEYDSMSEDCDYDSSYDPDEAEYKQWLEEQERGNTSYRYGSEYDDDYGGGYVDEGFEESFY